MMNSAVPFARRTSRQSEAVRETTALVLAQTRTRLSRQSNRSQSAPPIPAGKRLARPETGAGIFGDECLLRGAETGLSRAFPAKAPGSQRHFHPQRETGVARECVVGPAGLKPATNRLWAPSQSSAAAGRRLVLLLAGRTAVPSIGHRLSKRRHGSVVRSRAVNDRG